MIQVRAACGNKSCSTYGKIEVLNLPVVSMGGTMEAYPAIVCNQCYHRVSTEYVDPTTPAVTIDPT